MMAFILSLTLITSVNNNDYRIRWLNNIIPASKIVCTINSVPYQMCVTQSTLETGYGKNAPNNNYFGIKNGRHYAKYSTSLGSLIGYTSAINKNYRYAVYNYSKQPVKFMIWTWGTGYAKDENYVPIAISVMHGIYKRTGDENFNVRLTDSEKTIIRRLKKTSYGKQRRELTVKLMYL